jgi:hypothetical protein
MIVLLKRDSASPQSGAHPVALHREKGWWTVDSLDSVWLGMKLGVALIGMVMMRFLWRGILRSKRAGEHKER